MQTGEGKGSKASRWWAMWVALLALGTVLVSTSTPTSAQTDPDWALAPSCTPAESYDTSRQFVVTNNTGAAAEVVLRNQSTGDDVRVTAPVGDSLQLAHAAVNPTAVNTTQLIVGGVQQAVTGANNRVCAVLTGTASCNPATRETSVSWTITNNHDGPATIGTTSPATGLTFGTDPIPAGGTSVAMAPTIPGPDAREDPPRTLTVSLDFGGGLTSDVTATAYVGACNAPAPRVFTFTKSASVATAAVGDEITYTYTGTITGTGSLDVVEIVDDVLGVIPVGQSTTVVAGTAFTVPYVHRVLPGEAGRTIVNNAVMSVRESGNAQAAIGSATAQASVDIAQIPLPTDPVDPSTTSASTTTVVGATTTTVVPVTLPATGSGNATDVMIWLALGALASGVVAVRIARRS